MVNLDELVGEVKTLSSDQIEFHGQTIENLFAWYFSKMMTDDLIFYLLWGRNKILAINKYLKRNLIIFLINLKIVEMQN